LSSSVGGGRSLLKGEHALFYLIQRLVCLCKRDKPRRHKVCDCCDKESENCGQVNADAQEAGKQSFGIPVRVVPDCWDVVGLGQAMSYKLAAGGSLSNTLVALARLGVATSNNSTIDVAMTGSVGGDALGDFYRCI
jgi:hypothetical protein